MAGSIHKWWMLDLTNDEREFFQILARNPDYAWRSIESLMKELNWTIEKFVKVVQKHVNSKLVLMKIDKKGQKQMAYWERVSHISKPIKKPSAQKRHIIPRQNTLGGTLIPTTGNGSVGSVGGVNPLNPLNPCRITTPLNSGPYSPI